MFGKRFLPQIREYAALESRMNRDFSAPIRQLAQLEVNRLIDKGEDPEDALEQVNGALRREVQRFPVQLEDGQDPPF